VFTAVVCRLSLSVVASLGVGRARSRVAVCSIVQVAYVFASVFRAGRQDAKQRVPPVNDQRRWSARSPASPRRARTSNGSNGKLSALRGSVPTGAAGTGKAPAGAQHRTQQGPPTHFCVTCFGSTFSKVRLAVMVALLLAVAALWPLVAVKRQTCACLRVGTSLEAHELECWTKGAVASGSKWKGAGLERRGGAPGRRPIRCGEGGGWRRRGPH